MSKSQLLRKIIKEIISSDQKVGAVYCDMDGVLVDFENGAVNLISDILAGVADPMWTESSKSIESNIRKLRETFGEDWRPSRREDLDEKLVRQVMMSAISASPGDFFRMLPPLKDGTTELWEFLNSLGLPVHILSAPIRGRGMPADEGKKLWIREHLNPQPDSVFIVDAANKKNFAVSDEVPNILVDDKESTIISWNDSGGIGIFHEPGNSSRSVREIKLRFGL